MVLVRLPPQHLGQDTWEGESMRPLHRGHYFTHLPQTWGGSQLRDASRTGKDQTDHLPLD